MARPKRSVAAALRAGKAHGNHVSYPTVWDELQSRGLFLGKRGGAKQAVKVEGGRVLHMRAEKEAPWQDHIGAEHAGQREDRLEKKQSWMGVGSAVKLEKGRVVHMRAEKEAPWQDHIGAEHAGQREDRLEKKQSWMGVGSAVKLEKGRVVHMRAEKEAPWQDHIGAEHAGQREDRLEKKQSWMGVGSAVKLEKGRVVHMRAEKEAPWQEDHIGAEHAGQQEDRLEKKQSLVGGESSSVSMESNGEDLGGSDQDLAPAEAVHGCFMPQGTQNFGKHEHDAAFVNFGKHEHDTEFVCTACGRSVAIVEVLAHPVLHVGVCENCYDFLFSSPFTKDNPKDPFEHENECRWCGDGGEVILCDTCPKAFCKPCIKRNFGEEILNAIESPTQEWSCFVCDDYHLQTLIHAYKNVEKLVKTMNRSGQPQKSRTSRTSRECSSRMRSRRRSIGETTFESDTIATIIARKKAKFRREYPETNFTGFERIQQRRHPQHHFLFPQSSTEREHDTSKIGEPIPEVHLL